MITRKSILLACVAVGLFIGIGVGRYFLASPNHGSALPDFSSLYELVLSRAVDTNQSELFSVVLAETVTNEVESFTPLPSKLHDRLVAAWKQKGVHLDLLSPPDRIQAIWQEVDLDGHKIPHFQKFVDKNSQQMVRVYKIDSICWLGSDEVLVSWSGTEANLSVRGSKIKLKFEFGFWQWVEETDEWAS